jgi:hypothetical protein
MNKKPATKFDAGCTRSVCVVTVGSTKPIYDQEHRKMCIALHCSVSMTNSKHPPAAKNNSPIVSQQESAVMPLQIPTRTGTGSK